MKKRIGITLIVIGASLIAFAIGLLLYNSYENQKAQEQSDILINSIVDTVNSDNLKDTDPFDTEMKVVEIDGRGYIGYLEIPDFGLRLPVMAEWSYQSLKIAPCRYYGSTKTDNLVICAHNYRSHFGYIGKLNADATIIFTDMEGTEITYRVISTEILQPADTRLVKDTGDDLILYTCTYGGRTRIAVRCEKV